jgi:hypothetical protein
MLWLSYVIGFITSTYIFFLSKIAYVYMIIALEHGVYSVHARLATVQFPSVSCFKFTLIS